MPGGERTPPQQAPGGPFSPSAGLRIGDVHYDPATRWLTRDGQRVRIQKRPLSVLLYLVEHRDRVVSREELLETFWPAASSDESLTRCISTLRKCLGDSGDPPTYLETVWGEGYRLIAGVFPTEPATDSGAPPRQDGQATPPSPSGPDLPVPKRRWRWSTVLPATVLLLTLVLLVVRGIDQPGPDAIANVDFIAVLPIQGAFPAPWLASSLTDHLIQTVSRIEGLAVVAHATASQFSPESDPRQLGRRLGVDAVLVSEYASEDGGARLRSQLLSTRDGSLLWSYEAVPSTAEQDESQVLELADAVARSLWAALRLQAVERSIDPVAYRHYLRGRYFWSQRSAGALDSAIREFEQALVRQPDYLDALTGLADAWLLMPLYRAMPPTLAIPKARAAAERALQEDMTSARAHAVLGAIAMQYDWDWPEAERHLRRAITLNPNDPTAVQWLGGLHCYQRRFEECRRYYREAAGLDPLSPIIRMVQGSPDLYSGAYAEAIGAYRAVLTDLPDFRFTQLALGHALVGQRDWQGAVEAYEDCLRQLGPAIAGGPLVFALARSGRLEEARTRMAELEQVAADGYVPPSKLAIAHLGLGARNRALAELGRAVDEHDDRLVYLAVDPLYRELHGDPAFRDILARVGLERVLDAP